MSQIITIKEVRVLSGLSRGAAIPLESTVYIGSNPECDIFLLDPGVEDRHFSVVVDPDDRVMVCDLTVTAGAPTEQAESTPFIAGDVKLIWCNSDNPWQSTFDDDVAIAHIPSSGGMDWTAKISRRLGVKPSMLFACLLAIACITIAIINYRLRQSSVPAPATKAARFNNMLPSDLTALQAQIQDRFVSKAFHQLSVTTEADALTIKGTIRPEQEQELEMMIRSVRKENPLVRIRLLLTEPAPLKLPFDIVAMVGGSAPSILLSTSQSLSIGSESNGYKLASVAGTCLTFEQVQTHQRIKECLDPSSPNR